MKKFRFISFILSVITLFASVCFISACDKEQEPAKSALRGTFSHQEVIGKTSPSNDDPSIFLTVTDKLETAQAGINGKTKYLYTSYDVFKGAIDSPNEFNGYQSRAVFAYSINQQLKLNSDFTYVYKWTVLINNPCRWGSDFGKMVVNVSGTFTFESNGNDEYTVNLSKPTGGKQELYGTNSNNNSYYWLWNMHSEPDFVQNFDYADMFDNYDYTYVGEKTVVVNKKEKKIYDNLFIPTIFNEMTKYGTY